MSPKSKPSSLKYQLFGSTTAILAYVALADFVFHMLFATNYGYFRDELYYIVSGTQHLSLGYVDFPPFIAYVAALLYFVSKDSLLSIHAVSALNEALLVFVSGIIARELGGGKRAQIITALATMFSFGLLAFGSIFTPDSFDSLWWSLLGYLLIRTIKRHEPKFWIASGFVIGIGLMTKLTIFFFVGTIFLTFVTIPSARKYLRSKWVPLAALISILFILPMVYWNSINGWPMIHFYEEFRGDVSGGGPFTFFYTQLALMSFLDVPIFLLGLYFYLRSTELRAFGIAYIILYAFMTVFDMKPYYLAPIYPILYAGGAILIERSADSKSGIFRWFGSRPYIATFIVIALLLAPIGMPILSAQTLISKYGYGDYQGSPLPDRYGWSGMVSNLSIAYNTLPSSLRDQACIFTSNYGEASAVNFFGPSLGLPKAISGHNNYYVWGPDSCSARVLVTIGVSNSTLDQAFRNVSLLTTLDCQYCISYEQILPIYICTDPNFTSLASLWPQVRHYD
jgi:hypothetical protein